jgi:integrase
MLITMSEPTMQRYRLFRRGWGTFYAFDNITKKQTSLGTQDKDEAQRLLNAKNEAKQLGGLSLEIARTYLKACDPSYTTRTWQHVMDSILSAKSGETLVRWKMAVQDRPFDLIRHMHLVETRPEHFQEVLQKGTVSTNVYLRRLHNFALDMQWILAAVLPKRQWPKPNYKPKRGITPTEHEKIVAIEKNPERRAFYELCWHLGGAQTDVANLRAEMINWDTRTLSYERRKLRGRGKKPCIIQFSDAVEAILHGLPSTGLLFPTLATMEAKHRATEFRRCCRRAGVKGVTLHCYRYAWAERALAAGYPERYAQEALGHNSKAVHRAYARNAQVALPSLDEYEKAQQDKKIVTPNFKVA